MDTTGDKYPSVMAEWLEAITDKYVEELKMPPDAARSAAEVAMATIQELSYGGAVYIPKGYLFHVSEKHRRIYRRFDGRNHAQLAREFDLTARQIYTIVERIQQEEFERKQGKLFD